jgi:hypothetical protein
MLCDICIGALQHRHKPPRIRVVRQTSGLLKVVIPHHYTVETLEASAEFCQICVSLWNHLSPSSAEVLRSWRQGEDKKSKDANNHYLTELAIFKGLKFWRVHLSCTHFVSASTTIPELPVSYWHRYQLRPIAGKLDCGQGIT